MNGQLIEQIKICANNRLQTDMNVCSLFLIICLVEGLFCTNPSVEETYFAEVLPWFGMVLPLRCFCWYIHPGIILKRIITLLSPSPHISLIDTQPVKGHTASLQSAAFRKREKAAPSCLFYTSSPMKTRFSHGHSRAPSQNALLSFQCRQQWPWTPAGLIATLTLNITLQILSSNVLLVSFSHKESYGRCEDVRPTCPF